MPRVLDRLMTTPEHSQDLVPSPAVGLSEEDARLPEGEGEAESGCESGHVFDGDLVLGCLEGESGAVERLYRKSVDHLMMVARSSEKKNLRRWGASAFESLVHEIVAEAMGSDLAGLRRIAYFDKLGAGYHSRLMRTFSNRIIDRHRRWTAKEGRHLSMDADDGDRKLLPDAVDSGADPASAAVAAEFSALMERLMQEVLTPDERELIMDEMIGHSSRSERATRLGIKEGALAVKLFRIREKLKSALGEACQHSDYLR